MIGTIVRIKDGNVKSVVVEIVNDEYGLNRFSDGIFLGYFKKNEFVKVI